MSTDTKSRHIQDSFLEALQSEMVAGTENLTSWIRHVDSCGRIESLFELESWLKGLRSFFDVRHLPLSDLERRGLVGRAFGAELRIARCAIAICENLSGELIRQGWTEKVEFETFIENQLRIGKVLDYHVSKIMEQPTPEDSMIQLCESLNDLRVMIDAASGELGFQLFLSIGRCFRRDLRNCRYVEMLLAQRFRLQYDRVENAALGSLLRRIEGDQLRRTVALALLWLFRLLRYLRLIHRDLAADRPLRHSLVLFALLHDETRQLADFLRAQLLKGGKTGPALESAVELVVYSLKVEAERALQRELIQVPHEVSPAAIYAKVENSHGLLRNCFQSCILTLAQVFDPDFDGRTVFPAMRESIQKSQKLRKDLWELRRYLKDILQNRSAMDSNEIVERIAVFQDSSLRHLMYRDWGEFERLSDSVVTAGSPVELRALLRKFLTFLETLVGEVSKRSVLAGTETMQE